MWNRARDRVAPDWLVQVVRPAPAAPNWPRMIRAAVATTLPLVIGMAAGDVQAGIVPSMGGVNAAMNDQDGPYRLRLIRMGTVAVSGATGFLLGKLAAGLGWVTVLALVGIAVISSLVSVAGDLGSVIGLQLLVVAVLGSGMPLQITPWLGAAGFVAGALLCLLLAIALWPVRGAAPESAMVANVYRRLARMAAEPGEESLHGYLDASRGAYTAVLGARTVALGSDKRRFRLVALLNQGSLIKNALLAMQAEHAEPPVQYRTVLQRLARALERRGPAPPTPEDVERPASARALRSALCGAIRLVTGKEEQDTGPLPVEPSSGCEWLRSAWEKLRYGHLVRVYTLRLALCIGASGVLTEVVRLQRSYWVALTVALVLKPDFGSVFARALQRSIGTFVGALVGTAIAVLLPEGPILLIPLALMAGLMPYGQQRNWGLMATFQTPVVVLQVSLIAGGGTSLAETRLLDTLVGCGIVLVLGYLPWPSSWTAPVGPSFAGALEAVSAYLRVAFEPAEPRRGLLRRRAYDALADLRTVFQRATAEPPAVSRGVTVWWPSIVAARHVLDTTAAAAARGDHGGPAPEPATLEATAGAIDDLASWSRGTRPSHDIHIPQDGPLDPVIDAVNALHDALPG